MTTTYRMDKQQIINAEVPQETRTYKPITNQQLIELTLESIHQAGFELANEEYSGAMNGQISNSRYAIKNVADSEMQLQIGYTPTHCFLPL